MQTNDLLDKIFRGARSQNGWLPTPVADSKLRELYDLMKFGPTSVNCSPARLVFVRTEEGRAKLRPALAPGNVEKTMAAPVVAIVGYDTRFYEQLPELFPHNPAVKAWFEGDEKVDFANTTAFRNGTLQGGYLIAAARALGLDCGPMSGFNNQAVDQAFFAGTSIRSNFICGLGHGDPEKVFARSPRLSFEQACQLA
ncbi:MULTISPECIES: malonic semialdehyde reductase [unclassified Cupriavidus]|uniref:malonic semialdehyde reductase n=1 Tax=unclassified Cupriavidus TaxID=2640874 RepID=UPI001AE66488|nr:MULTISPECIES: malonic semialdehyde reductase [unclassified Cupriavidus]MBP0630405.1 malonic semialdehyde reductase [Cupriavidus sp. AcVe19-1a]MBP0638736.1 malonic semialdehyde reductase [Cupriavidus sp. AcVe19-6a]